MSKAQDILSRKEVLEGVAVGDIADFPKGTVARDNQSDETFILNKDVKAAKENKNAYRIVGELLQGPKSYDAHWIFLSDNKKLKGY